MSRQLHPVLSPEERRRLFHEGIDLFNRGEHFEAHETWEEIWRSTTPEPRDLFQGLIQVAVAMRHLESHNIRGASILLRAGMGRLQRYPAVYKGLHLAAWLQRLETLLEYLDTLPSPTAYQFNPAQVPPLVSLE